MAAQNFYLALFVTVAAIPALYGTSNRLCDERVPRCVRNFVELSRDLNGMCSNAKAAMNCVRNLNCDSSMYMLTSQRQISLRLDDRGIPCDLGNFLRDFPPQCVTVQHLQTCVVTYTDFVIKHALSGVVDKGLLCRDLNDYVGCQLSWNGARCDVTKDTLRVFANNEKDRLHLSEECAIPLLDNGSTRGMTSIFVVAITTLLSLTRLF